MSPLINSHLKFFISFPALLPVGHTVAENLTIGDDERIVAKERRL